MAPPNRSSKAPTGPAQRSRLHRAKSSELKRSPRKAEDQGVADEPRDAAQQLRYLLAHTPAVLYVVKVEGDDLIPTLVSENIERLLGFTPAESARDEWWVENLHPEDRDRAVVGLTEAVRSDGYSMEYRVRHKNGSYHWIEDNSRVVRDATGRAQQMVGVWADITERKRTERRLREQADIIERAQDAIIKRDFGSDVVTVWNSGAERLYGWKASEAIGRPLGELIYNKSQDCGFKIEELLPTGGFHGERRHRTKDGSEVVVDARVTLVRDTNGTPQAVLGINTDITERKKLERYVLRTQRLESIGTLASGVAHDLNNVLVPILMVVPMLRGDPSPDERENFLNAIETSAQRGADIVRQVLTFAGGARGDRVLLQPIHLIEEIAKIAKQTFPKTVMLRTSYAEDLRLIEADSTQLHQVLLNLCLNARDAMPEGGTLLLSAENFDVDEQSASMRPGVKPGPYILISVSDNGPGIPRQFVDKIFDPFFTTKEPGKGTGLGLSSALGIVRSHGGSINVSSTANGTIFDILLPSSPGDFLDDETRMQLEVPTGHGETILIVDDEPTIREVGMAVLSKSGYKVLVAEDGPSALALFVRHSKRIGVVLTDVVMPIMSGLVLARTLRKMGAKAKIIISGARDSDYNPAELPAIGVQGFLNKPYSRERLLCAIDRVLHNDCEDKT